MCDKTAGNVYILSNKAMPNLLKIGFTLRSVEERAKELSGTTSLPFPFVIEFQVPAANAEKSESAIHEALKEHRVNNKREFFEVDLDKAMEVTVKNCISKTARKVVINNNRALQGLRFELRSKRLEQEREEERSGLLSQIEDLKNEVKELDAERESWWEKFTEADITAQKMISTCEGLQRELNSVLEELTPEQEFALGYVDEIYETKEAETPKLKTISVTKRIKNWFK